MQTEKKNNEIIKFPHDYDFVAFGGWMAENVLFSALHLPIEMICSNVCACHSLPHPLATSPDFSVSPKMLSLNYGERHIRIDGQGLRVCVRVRVLVSASTVAAYILNDIFTRKRKSKC